MDHMVVFMRLRSIACTNNISASPYHNFCPYRVWTKMWYLFENLTKKKCPGEYLWWHFATTQSSGRGQLRAATHEFRTWRGPSLQFSPIGPTRQKQPPTDMRTQKIQLTDAVWQPLTASDRTDSCRPSSSSSSPHRFHSRFPP